MSECPGFTLEEWLEDNYYIDLNNSPETAPVKDPRVAYLDAKQFRNFVALFEHHREHIEYLLEDFDEENQSWRAYNSSVFGFITNEEEGKAYAYLEPYRIHSL